MTMQLVPYFVMNGNAKEAIDFYQKALGAELFGIQTFGDMPANPDFPLPDSAKGLVSHALLKVGESSLMLSDTFPGQSRQSGNQVTVCITINDSDKAKQIFEALGSGGQITMPLQATFFSPAYGSLIDKYGVSFQIFVESGEQKNL